MLQLVLSLQLFTSLSPGSAENIHFRFHADNFICRPNIICFSLFTPEIAKDWKSSPKQI